MNALSPDICRKARLSRDVRFDGHFFIAVKTTGIFCRPICPANAPKEENVEYFLNAAQAATAGYRPCLRCRPDSAPGSWAWKGVETTVHRAIKLIEQGALQSGSLSELSDRLGITDRYLRQLFQKHLGMSPKQYAQSHQLMFAKQLLHNSTMSIAEIALASGFNSTRRFNDAFQKQLKLTPRDLRRGFKPTASNQIALAYRPPFHWQHMLAFYQMRLAQTVEWIDGNQYGRRLVINDSRGWFSVEPAENNTLTMQFHLDDVRQLRALVGNIRRMLDLDADCQLIEEQLAATPLKQTLLPGLRIPGVWSAWEAGVRAVLGQQVSIKAAITHLNHLLNKLSENKTTGYFPTPKMLANADLSFLKMPQRRKDTLKALAEFVDQHPNAQPTEWLPIPGIGPWTIQYAQLRGLSEPDHFLATDLVIKKVLATLPSFDVNTLSPWGSYATFHCWNSLS